VRNLHLFLTKVAVKVTSMHKHFKCQLYTQTIYLQIMLNISRHLARNSDFLSKVCVAFKNFAPHYMKLLGNLTTWRAVLDWCLAGSFLQLLLGHYSVRIGHQREQNCIEIVLKHVFQITLLHFAQYLIKVACKKEKCCKKLQYKIPGTSLKHIMLHKF